MQVQCMLLLAVALVEGDKLLEIRKCCGAFEMLSADGQSCEEAPGLLASSLQVQGGTVGAPLDAQWLSRWLQPGLSPDRVGSVRQRLLASMRQGPLLRAVWTTEKMYGNHSVASKEVFLRGTKDPWLLVPGSDSFELGHASSNMYDILLKLKYCMDASSSPLRSFQMLVEPICDVNLCITKCCPRGQVVMTQGDGWTCDAEEREDWWQANSSLIDLQEPFFLRGWNTSFENVSGLPRELTLDPEEAWAARLLRDRYHFAIFSDWDTCIDLKRREDGTLRYTLFYWENSKDARGDNGMPRYLYFIPVALLVVSLGNILRDRHIRAYFHGWCVVCYGACLLGFDIGQLAYYLSTSEEINDFGFVPPHLTKTCLDFAIPMYFMLMAANCWHAALCINMALNFMRTSVIRRPPRMNIYVLSAFSWGLPTLLTGLCVYGLEHDSDLRKWYSPTLTETRTCFSEVVSRYNSSGHYLSSSYKSGTALFYYGPALLLTIISTSCILYSFRQVQFLRRGNSVIQRAENPEQEDRQTKKQNSRLEDQCRSLELFLKMLLMSGIIETLLEFIVWLSCYYSNEKDVLLYDHMLSYRVAGYAVDIFRAVYVVSVAAQVGVGKCKCWRRAGCGGRGREELEMRVLGGEASGREVPGGET